MVKITKLSKEELAAISQRVDEAVAEKAAAFAPGAVVVQRRSIFYWLNGAVVSVSVALAIFFWVHYMITYQKQMPWFGLWFLYFLLVYPIIVLALFVKKLLRFDKKV